MSRRLFRLLYHQVSDLGVPLIKSGYDSREMIVFRIEDAKSGKFGLVTIHNLKGTPSELGFIPHIRYLTEKQKERILSCIDRDNYELYDSNGLPTEGHQAIIGYNEMYRNFRHYPYQSKIKDSSILLGAVDVDDNKEWMCNSSIDRLREICNTSINNFNTILPKPLYYFTTNSHNVISLDNCGKLFECYITDSDYAKIRSLYSIANDSIIDRLKARRPLKNSKLTGYWSVTASDSTEFQPEGYVFLDKDGNMQSEYTYYSKVPSEKTFENSGSPIFKIENLIKGTYKLGESTIKFKSSNPRNPKYVCVSVKDALFAQDSLTSYYTKDIAKYTSWYKRRMDKVYNIHDGAIIKSVDKQNLVLADAGQPHQNWLDNC